VSEELRLAHNVFHPFSAFNFVPGGREIRRAGELRQQFQGLPVVIEIDEKRELRRPDWIDLVHQPGSAALSRIPEPLEPPCEIANLNEIEVSVSVDIHW
jgi:hypothetical protein